ncbi:sugar ABC transporter permease [Atopobacter sp. AH10]|uniref:carbohydrate ABC transporter permease n=1 Tax=Atopobacter sp. AH10 TaxID=2315861 RepID=UPI000EF1F9E0|nr:sugar ABC transporter permease [Atopobacter sp. AH10]RLK63328.1 sugar ABC transporter permease [Atopobacter sp. AH10]
MKKAKPYLFLSPMLVIMGVFVVYPIIRTLLYSFYRLKLTDPTNVRYIGWENYRVILHSADFYRALANSAYILAFVLILGLGASLVVALMLNRQSRLSPILTAIAIIPWALPPIVNGIIWQFIFYPGYGLLNKLLLSFGFITHPLALTNQRLTLMAIAALVLVFRVVPFCAILLLAGLQAIPHELYEASRVDGANTRQNFTYITLPLLLPHLTVVLIQLTMAGLNIFDEMVALSGYRLESQTLLVYNYMNTFSFLNFGYGSAITYLIMILSGLIGFIYIKSMAGED